MISDNANPAATHIQQHLNLEAIKRRTCRAEQLPHAHRTPQADPQPSNITELQTRVELNINQFNPSIDTPIPKHEQLDTTPGNFMVERRGEQRIWRSFLLLMKAEKDDCVELNWCGVDGCGSLFLVGIGTWALLMMKFTKELVGFGAWIGDLV
ncbi:hypothetical protein Droror1_Dr00001320 [Drosera rotundifolia]